MVTICHHHHHHQLLGARIPIVTLGAESLAAPEKELLKDGEERPETNSTSIEGFTIRKIGFSEKRGTKITFLVGKLMIHRPCVFCYVILRQNPNCGYQCVKHHKWWLPWTTWTHSKWKLSLINLGTNVSPTSRTASLEAQTGHIQLEQYPGDAMFLQFPRTMLLDIPLEAICNHLALDDFD